MASQCRTECGGGSRRQGSASGFAEAAKGSHEVLAGDRPGCREDADVRGRSCAGRAVAVREVVGVLARAVNAVRAAHEVGAIVARPRRDNLDLNPARLSRDALKIAGSQIQWS